MKKVYLLGILFFASLWGSLEATLGGYLYASGNPFASVPLTVIAFIILTIAKIYLPQRGSAVFIGSIAMLYKFLNTPFFGCHLLAIFLLGLSYELVFNLFRIKSKAILALSATYLGYALFALSITYLLRYPHWIKGGFFRILRYVGINGTLAAFFNAVFVPLSFSLGKILKKRTLNPFEFKSKIATGSVSLVTFLLWFLVLAKWF